MMDLTPSDVVSVPVSGTMDRSTAGLLGAGQRLARRLDGRHHVLLPAPMDPEILRECCHCSDGVFVVENPAPEAAQPEVLLGILARALKPAPPAAILFPNDTVSQELTPRLAHRLGGAAIGDAQQLQVNEGRIRVARSVYGGKAVATVELCKAPAVIWIRARAMDPPEFAHASASVEPVTTVVPTDLKTRMTERQVESGSGGRLEEASVIVSGGRGIGGPEGFEELKALAAAMGAQTAASRAACDLGWAPHSWQVGQTGKKVAPDLYLAIGLSGASQHLMGIADAKAIAAINTDPDAPIFKHCRFGLVQDYRTVIGPLRERLAALLK